MTYFSLLPRMQKKASCRKVFRMSSSAPDLKHILQKLNILAQRQIIQPVPVVSDCLGHFVPIYFSCSPSLLCRVACTMHTPPPFLTCHLWSPEQQHDVHLMMLLLKEEVKRRMKRWQSLKICKYFWKGGGKGNGNKLALLVVLLSGADTGLEKFDCCTFSKAQIWDNHALTFFFVLNLIIFIF